MMNIFYALFWFKIDVHVLQNTYIFTIVDTVCDNSRGHQLIFHSMNHNQYNNCIKNYVKLAWSPPSTQILVFDWHMS